MRTSTLKMGFSILILFLSIQLLAQQRTYYNYDYPWTFGLNGGAAWQYSDVDAGLGYGFGLDLAKRIGGRQNSWFALDARGRLMFARQYGQGSERVYNLSDFSALSDSNNTSNYNDLGYAFHNHRTSLGALDLEGVITLNRLRERTGWSVQLFGGIGIGLYDVETDQLDGLGNLYEYNLIDTTQRNGRIRRDIRARRDGIYDGAASGFENGIRGAIMPSLGLAVGYQLTPRFAVGLEHKATWAMADNLDGVINVNSPRPDDVHHYTSLYLRWTLGGSGNDPIIEITAPRSSPYTVRVPTGTVRADIKNVNRRSNVDVYLNGSRIDYFDFNTATEEFFLTVPLVQGQNTVKITARNDYGSAQESTIFIYQPQQGNPNNGGNNGNNGNNSNPNNGNGGNNNGGNTGNPQPTVQAPTVNILNPEDNPFVTDANNVRIDARVTNINSKNDIIFTVNGNRINNFSYSRNRVNANINLQDGNNVIEISARNARGEVRDSRRIVYQRPQVQAPSITFLSPNRNPYTVTEDDYSVRARIENVTNNRNITLRVNGTSEPFSFRNGELGSLIDLQVGANVIEISAYNDGGTADENTTIVYKKANAPTPPPTPTAKPTVRITSPSGNPHKTDNAQVTVYAAIQNVNSQNELTLNVNGKSSAFSFDARRGKFSANIGLVEGNNTVEIQANNNGGTARDFVNIVYKKDKPAPKAPNVTIKTPKSNPYVSPVKSVSITAVVTGVESKGNIQFIWNGKRFTNFTYNTNTNLLQAKLTLSQGENTYQIIATNAGGKDEASGKITFKTQPTVNKPVITLVTPSRSPFTAKTAKITVQARIANVTSRADLTVTIGGKTTNTFSFSRGMLKLNMSIPNGGTTVEITATNKGGTDKETLVLNYTQPKTPPIITFITPSKSPHFTSDNYITVKVRIQHISGKQDLKIMVNGSEFAYPTQLNGEYLTFQMDITNQETIVITATNSDGVDTETMVINKKVQKPEIKLINPRSNNANSKTANFEVRATVLHINNKNDIKLNVNGKNVTNFSFSNNTLRYGATLENGRTPIVITATNNDGNATQTINLNYSKPKQPPVITFITPSRSPHKTSDDYVTVKARIQHISGKRDLKIMVNGSEFAYPTQLNGEYLTFQMDITNTETIVITATNADGSDVETMVINKTVPAQKPVIILRKPNGTTAKTTNASETITMIVQNAKSKSEVQLSVNGKRMTNFNFDTKTGTLVAKVPLKTGANRLVISAQNAGGKASKTIVYTRQVAVQNNKVDKNINSNKKTETGTTSKPVIKFTNPKTTGTTVTKKNYIVKANVSNVTSKGINVMVNGKLVEGVSYNEKNGQLIIRTNLKSGNNTILISATNKNGTVKQTTLIKYRATPRTEDSGRN